MSRTAARATLAAIAALTLLGGTAAPPAQAVGPARPAATPAAGHYTGSLADGATWVADVPAYWNHALVLYSHGFGTLTAQDAPDSATQAALLARGYALVGSSYTGPSLWALARGTKDQFGALAAFRHQLGTPRRVLAMGTSMGGLISAQEDQRSRGRVDGVLTTCGLLGGGVNLNNYELDGEYAIAQLLLPGQAVKLVNYANEGEAVAAANQLATAVQQAQQTPQGRARVALAAALLNTPDWATGTHPPRSYAAQEQQEAQVLPQQLLFVIGARPSIEQAVGGNASWNAGVNYTRLLQRSAMRSQVRALYRSAGLRLKADTRRLTAHADIRADRTALRTLRRTSTVSGRLRVPELTMHTISDQLAPIAYENIYRRFVTRQGDRALLRQSYVESIGHCNFSPAELVAGLQTVDHRVRTGHWPRTGAAAMNRRAKRTGLGTGACLAFEPPRFANLRGKGKNATS